MTACGRSAKAKRVCRCSAGVKECQGQSKIRSRNRAGKRAQLVRVSGCFRAAYFQGDAKGGKSIHDDFSRTAGRSAFITPSLFMAVTLAEGLAYAWQSGPRMPSASHWLRQAPSGRSAYPLIRGGGGTTESAAGTGGVRAGSNNATCLPRARPAPPSQSQGLVLAANALAGLIAPPLPLRLGHTLCPEMPRLSCGPSLTFPCASAFPDRAIPRPICGGCCCSLGR
jgi:hypothetical protein